MLRKKDTVIPSNHRYERIYPSYTPSSSTKLTAQSSKVATDRFFPGQASYAFVPPKERLYGSNYDPPQSASNGKFGKRFDSVNETFFSTIFSR